MMWFRRLMQRLKIGHLINQAEAKQSAELVVDLLTEFPDAADRVAETAERHHINSAQLYALIHCTGLVLVNSGKHYPLVKRLIYFDPESGFSVGYPIPWDRLTAGQCRKYASFIHQHGDSQAVKKFYECLTAPQLRAIRPDVSANEFAQWLSVCLARGITSGDALAPFLSHVRLASSSNATSESLAAAELLESCYQAAADLLASPADSGLNSAALKTVSVLWSSRNQPIEEQVLAGIAQRLESFKPDDLLRAADLLRHYRSSLWAQALKQCWLANEDKVRKESIDGGIIEGARVVQQLEIAAGAILSALGSCASLEEQAVDLEIDRVRIPQVTEAQRLCRELYKKHQQAHAIYDAASVDQRGQRVTPPQELADELMDLREQILDQNDILQEFHDRRDEFSSAYLLLQVLRDQQSFSSSVRQGAAWGLHLLVTEGPLVESTRVDCVEAIQEAVNDDSSIDFRERRIHCWKDKAWASCRVQFKTV